MKRRRPIIAPLLMIIGGLALILAAVIFMLSSQSPSAQPTQASSNTNDTEATVQAIKRVSLGDAKAALELKTALFLDARDPASYEQGHIPGAINIPEYELSSRLGELNQSDWIITYCT